jgi:hypothetical protein
MNDLPNQDPKPYIEMKEKGANAEMVFKKAQQDGFKNFECIALICGVFDLELHKAREIAHGMYMDQSSRQKKSQKK